MCKLAKVKISPFVVASKKSQPYSLHYMISEFEITTRHVERIFLEPMFDNIHRSKILLIFCAAEKIEISKFNHGIAYTEALFCAALPPPQEYIKHRQIEIN